MEEERGGGVWAGAPAPPPPRMHTKASPSHHPVWDCMAGTSGMFGPWRKLFSLGQASSMSSSDGGTGRARSNSVWYRPALHSLVGSGPKSQCILWQEKVAMYFPFHCDPLLFMSHLFLSSLVKRVPAVCFKRATPAHTDHGRVIKSFCRSLFCGSRRLRQSPELLWTAISFGSPLGCPECGRMVPVPG